MAVMRCFGCGVEKDTEKLERYSGSLGITKEEDIEPLFVLDVEPWESSPGPWRAAVVCHACFDKLEPDMWISSSCWRSIDPVLRFEQLPPLPNVDERQDAAFFADLALLEPREES
jgi:hypothetical protein